MAEVDIGDETYFSLASLDDADLYLGADDRYADLWGSFTDDEKGRKLVTGTRIMLRQPWKVALDLNAVPPLVRDATVEFAAALGGGYDLGVDPAANQIARRQKAGSVEVEYFRDLDNPLYRPPPIPKAAWDLIKGLLQLGGEGGLAASIATGTSGSRVRGCGLGEDLGFVGFGDFSRAFE